jgi:D-alanine-D-alanine ligase
MPGGGDSPVDKNDFSIIHNGSKVKFDAVLIGIHGTPGEDGKLQGYFDMLELPYSTCDASTSALTFNKRFTVAVAALSGISVSRSLHFYKDDPFSPEDIAAKLKFPLFIKPANGGSSIGMSKVPDISGITHAFEKAFKEDDQVLVEEMVEGREFTIGVFRSEGTIITLPMTEIRVKEGVEFFNFEAKYEGKSEEITPANASPKHFENIEVAAKKIYQVFNCSGIVRIDFIYHEATDTPYMLEINTVPGQSAASIVPQQVKAYGWTLRAFYGALLKEILP